jgi:multiple sugar transport system substrate-binding protein
MMAPAVGKAKYTDEKYAAWWSKLGELRDNQYINKDYNSIEFYQAQDNFKKGNAGMTLTVGSGAVDFVKNMGTDKVGIATFPKWGAGKFAGPLQLSSQTVGITSWSKYPKESADFIMFMHSPERVNAMYKASGAFPADDRFDQSLLATDQEKAIAKLASENVSPWGENYIPSQFDEQAYYFGVQEFFNGTSPADMAKKCQDIIEKWQKEQPDSVKNFQKWYDSLAQ